MRRGEGRRRERDRNEEGRGKKARKAKKGGGSYHPTNNSPFPNNYELVNINLNKPPVCT